MSDIYDIDTTLDINKDNSNLTIYIDMDGVLANFDLAQKAHPKYNAKDFRPDLELDFSTFTPMPGAIDAVAALIDMGHDVYVATTPPWDHPDSWGQKRNWIANHLPQLKKKMFLTHRKDLLKGDILIDDSCTRGQPDFEGEWMHFGSAGMDWPYVVETIQNMTNMLKVINK
tara:strand:- start:9 stop:521 length:513 start_codon:yes stop_codon:yes gene_type:complete